MRTERRENGDGVECMQVRKERTFKRRNAMFQEKCWRNIPLERIQEKEEEGEVEGRRRRILLSIIM